MFRFHRPYDPGLTRSCAVLLITGIFLPALTSCSAQTATPISTAAQPAEVLPSATLAATFTSEPLATGQPLQQATPIIITQPTSVTPEATATTEDTSGFPTNPLNILTPGTGSKIISPLQITAFALPGYNGKVTLQLWGEDARLMGEQLVKLGTETKWITFESKIPFEITSAGESAVLTMTTFDEYKRRIAVNSINLILMQMGNPSIENNSYDKQAIYIKRPYDKAVITNGVLHIEGFARPYSTSPFIIELIKTNGAILASKQIVIKTPPAGNLYSPYSVDIPYTVSESTPVRLTIYQTNDHAPLVDLILDSQAIILKP
jgi:hypothetical protein